MWLLGLKLCITIIWSVRLTSGTALLSDLQSLLIKIQLKCHYMCVCAHMCAHTYMYTWSPKVSWGTEPKIGRQNGPELVQNAPNLMKTVTAPRKSDKD